MNYYLIDFENVPSKELSKIIDSLKDGIAIFFYSNACKSIELELINHLMQNNINIFFEKDFNGTKNALDFQLSTYLGYLIKEKECNGQHCNFHIVSKDSGYDCMISYWKEKNVKIRRISVPSSNTQNKQNTNSKKRKTRK